MRTGFIFIDDAICIKKGCNEIAVRQFNWSVGTKFCLCPRHQKEAILAENAFAVFEKDEWNQDKIRERDEQLRRRVTRCGLPRSVVEVLQITPQKPDGKLNMTSSFKPVGELVLNFLKAFDQGVLVLSGANGIGKSVAAGWAAWSTRGRFVPRSEWAKLTTWDKDHAEMLEYIEHNGVLVLDEVLQKADYKEGPESMRVLNMIVCERHDNRRPTILTTRSDKESFFHALGNDILDRAREFQTSFGSGFHAVEGRSLRGRI